MTHPEKWYIPVTEENHAELNRWRLSKRTQEASRWDRHFRPGSTLLSAHPDDDDGSYFYMKGYSITKRDNGYQEITLEQFRQITNSQPMKHPEYWPEYWCIEATKENFSELYAWWRNNAAECYTGFQVGYTLMSDHPRDESKYYGGSIAQCLDDYPQFVEITLEQFRQITNSNQNQTTMTKQIQISRELLNEYYNAATSPQKAYLSEHFKLDGRTTDEAIRRLHDMACSTWKPKIKANHPDCFPEDSKYFDFSKHANKSVQEKRVVSADVCESLGLTEGSGGFIQVRNNSNNPETHHRSFYLNSKYNWELVQDGTESGRPVMILIPTKKSC
jgi:hypothetical protein